MTGERPAGDVKEERCPTCGQAVRVVTSDEGTSHFERAAEQEAERLREEREAAIDAINIYGDEILHTALEDIFVLSPAALSHHPPEENPDA